MISRMVPIDILTLPKARWGDSSLDKNAKQSGPRLTPCRVRPTHLLELWHAGEKHLRPHEPPGPKHWRERGQCVATQFAMRRIPRANGATHRFVAVPSACVP